MSDKDRKALVKMRKDTDTIMAKRRRIEMTRQKGARQKGLEEY